MDEHDYDEKYGGQRIDVRDSEVGNISQVFTRIVNYGLPYVAIVAVFGFVIVAIVNFNSQRSLTPSDQTLIPSATSTPTASPTPPVLISLTVNRYISTTIQVRAGEKITIQASGFIKVGDFVGSVDPNGRTAGILGASLEAYNLQPNFPHGGLMCRVRGESQWRFCGINLTFIAPVSDILEFNVNDNDQGNNVGSFDVTVQID